MALTIGMKAPDFTLYNTEKEKISLSNYYGQPVVLLFFPLAFTSVCTAELCQVRDQLSWFNLMKSQVFGISVDSLYTLARYKSELQLNFPLLSDFNKEVSNSYGCLYDVFAFEMKGVSKRSVFLIDENGFLSHIQILENAGDLPNFHAIESGLLALKESN